MNLGFTTNAQLQKHIKKEHANCMFCDRKCSSQRELQKHIETQHSGASLEERKNIPCPYLGCNKNFTKNYNLGVHIRTAHDGQRYICGTFDVSNTSDISSWSGIDACGKDLVSKANLEDHIRTAHLGRPSLINGNRQKPPSFIADEDENNEMIFVPKKKMMKKPKKQRPSAIDELLGNSYAADSSRTIPCLVPSCKHMFIRDYDLQQHIRRKHASPIAETNENAEEAADDFDSNFNLPEFRTGAAVVEGSAAFQEMDKDEDAAREELDAMYEPTELDWEIQRRALEGGPFWVGAEEDEGQGRDQWLREEMEMRALVGEEVSGVNIDPALG
jgi:general transcription factor IIIA